MSHIAIELFIRLYAMCAVLLKPQVVQIHTFQMEFISIYSQIVNSECAQNTIQNKLLTIFSFKNILCGIERFYLYL